LLGRIADSCLAWPFQSAGVQIYTFLQDRRHLGVGAVTGGCDSLKMLAVVAKYELALNGSTGLRTKRSHVRVEPGASANHKKQNVSKKKKARDPSRLLS
jgi:hypothetical protein